MFRLLNWPMIWALNSFNCLLISRFCCTMNANNWISLSKSHLSSPSKARATDVWIARGVVSPRARLASGAIALVEEGFLRAVQRQLGQD